MPLPTVLLVLTLALFELRKGLSSWMETCNGWKMNKMRVEIRRTSWLWNISPLLFHYRLLQVSEYIPSTRSTRNSTSLLNFCIHCDIIHLGRRVFCTISSCQLISWWIRNGEQWVEGCCKRALLRTSIIMAFSGFIQSNHTVKWEISIMIN